MENRVPNLRGHAWDDVALSTHTVMDTFMKRTMTTAALFGYLLFASRVHAEQAAAVPTVEANKTLELAFASKKTYTDPFNEIELDVVVTAPGGEQARVPAFWAGGQNWKLRFASGAVGDYRYRTECS